MLCVRSTTGHNVGQHGRAECRRPPMATSVPDEKLNFWFGLKNFILSSCQRCVLPHSQVYMEAHSHSAKLARAPAEEAPCLFVITLAFTESPVLFVRLFLTSITVNHTSTSLLALFPLPIKSFSSVVVGKVEGGISENVFLASFSGDGKSFNI